MANIIVSGTTEASSSEFTLAAGASATIFLTGGAVTNSAEAHILIKGADATFTLVGKLTGQYPTTALEGAGTYKVTRKANAVAFGVDSV